jgi:hypothetical protein
MDEKQYDALVTDFYSRISIDIALGKHKIDSRTETGELLRSFLHDFNRDLAAPLLAKLDTQHPEFADKVQYYPEYYWLSRQAGDYVYNLSYQLFDNTLNLKKEDTKPFNAQEYSVLIKTAFDAAPHLPERADRSLSNVLNQIGHTIDSVNRTIAGPGKINDFKENLTMMMVEFTEQAQNSENAQLKAAFNKMITITQSFMKTHFPANHLDAIQKIRQNSFPDSQNQDHQHKYS